MERTGVENRQGRAALRGAWKTIERKLMKR